MCVAGIQALGWSKNLAGGISAKEGVGCRTGQKQPPPSQVNTALCRGHWAGWSSPELTLQLSVLAKHGKDMAKPSWPFPNIDPLVAILEPGKTEGILSALGQ